MSTYGIWSGIRGTDQAKCYQDAALLPIRLYLRRLSNFLFRSCLFVQMQSVDYEAMAKSEAFKAYSELACELQRCDLDTLDLRQRTAFFINIYNVLVMHATTQYDSPKTSWDRYKVRACV